MKIALPPSVFLAVLLAFIVSVGCTTTQSPHRQVDDLRITAEVKSKLAKDVKPSSLVNIKVNTTNGVVTLAGQVETEQVKKSAEFVAFHVRGVVGVNNNLQVEPLPARQTRSKPELPKGARTISASFAARSCAARCLS